ncbi:MAG: glycosyltransferase family 2 protein [Culicoidibacterales bacterium]
MICASIVTYNPDIKILLDNINAIYKQVDLLIIIDNNSNNIEEIDKLVGKFKISIIKNNTNKGIAKALNQALEYANNKNIDWLLTLDQDSKCDLNIIEQYKKNLNFKNTIIYCPQILDINIQNNVHLQNSVEEVDFAITSGSLINVAKSLEINGFDNSLFIDYVDFDFCIRARDKGYDIFRVNEAILYHRLGESEIKKILGFEVQVTHHSPVRRYYLYRNKVNLYRKHWKKHKKWVFKNSLSSIKVFFIIVFFEKERKDKLKYILKGIREGLF